MELKRFFIYYLDLFIIIMLLTYIIFSFQTLSLPSFPENNSFLYGSTNLSYQFYDNMRFRDKNISFSISKCNSFQKTNFINALDILENKTILSFYEVEKDQELELFCEDLLIKEGGYIIAGEGGPVLIKQSGDYYVIEKSQALLRQESKCSSPNTALHEILHGFGFNHSFNPSNILYRQSYCGQELSEDILEKINEIYFINSYPDLSLENSYFNYKENFLEINATIKNIGLNISENNLLFIYINEDLLKSFEIPDINFGESLNFNVKNLFFEDEINSLIIIIQGSKKELNFENNKVVFKGL